MSDEVSVFAPGLLLSVSVNGAVDGAAEAGDETHFHAAGQGFWVARLVRQLGAPVVLCAPLGGEAGAVIAALLARADVHWAGIELGGASPVQIVDRRGGDRVELVLTSAVTLDRHDQDDLYGAALSTALKSRACVLTGNGQAGRVAPEFFGRLAKDMRRAGVRVVADIHGAELEAVLVNGGLDVLKVSHDELIADGLAVEDDPEALSAAVEHLVGRGAANVVVSRASAPTIAWLDGGWYTATSPELEVVEPRGAGDAMTAALAVGAARALAPRELLARACAAGSATVTRTGLASAKPDLMEALVPLVNVVSHDGRPVDGR